MQQMTLDIMEYAIFRSLAIRGHHCQSPYSWGRLTVRRRRQNVSAKNCEAVEERAETKISFFFSFWLLIPTSRRRNWDDEFRNRFSCHKKLRFLHSGWTWNQWLCLRTMIISRLRGLWGFPTRLCTLSRGCQRWEFHPVLFYGRLRRWCPVGGWFQTAQGQTSVLQYKSDSAVTISFAPTASRVTI